MKLLSIIFITLLAGCSASGPMFEKQEIKEPGKASVYIYRPWHLKDGAGYANILMNGVKKFELTNNCYELILLDSGKYKITASGSFLTNWMAPDVSAEIDVENGKEYFLRLYPENTGAIVIANVAASYGGASLTLVKNDIAITEIVKTRKIKKI
jgi:hypothetical protein